MVNPDVVVLFPFGENDDLLEYAAVKFSDPHITSIFTTSNFATFFRPITAPSSLFIAEEKEGKYLSTLGFAFQFAELREKKGWKNIVVVAAPPHLKRALRDIRKAVGKNQSLSIIGVKPAVKCSWFKSRSKALKWWLREIILRIMPFRLYQKVAA